MSRTITRSSVGVVARKLRARRRVNEGLLTPAPWVPVPSSLVAWPARDTLVVDGDRVGAAALRATQIRALHALRGAQRTCGCGAVVDALVSSSRGWTCWDCADTVPHAELEHLGALDYWEGCGDRWDENAGCLFAEVRADSTPDEIVEQWLADHRAHDELPDCDEGALRAALEAPAQLAVQNAFAFYTPAYADEELVTDAVAFVRLDVA